MFFSALAGVGVFSGLVLFGVDRARLGGVLERPGEDSAGGSIQS